MKKRYFLLSFLFIITGLFYPLDKTNKLSNITFEAVNAAVSEVKIEDDELKNKYNIAYSSFLPAGGIYSALDKTTGKEAVIQIGLAKVDKSPYTLYMPEAMFNFFAISGDKKSDKVSLELTFLGWHKNSAEALYLDIMNFIVEPEASKKEIADNGLEKNYIQIGAFNFYQNAYPQVVKVIPLFKIIPRFYLLKAGENVDKDTNIYRILAGPFSLEDARKLVKEINRSIKYDYIYIHSGESIISKFN